MASFCHSAEIDRSIYFVRSLADDFVAHVYQRRRRRRLNIRHVTRSPRAGVLQFKDLIHAPALFYWVLYRLDDSAWQAQVEEEDRKTVSGCDVVSACWTRPDLGVYRKNVQMAMFRAAPSPNVWNYAFHL